MQSVGRGEERDFKRNKNSQASKVEVPEGFHARTRLWKSKETTRKKVGRGENSKTQVSKSIPGRGAKGKQKGLENKT